MRLRIYLDSLPDTREKVSQFKSYLVALHYSPDFRRARIRLSADQITKVRSHDHVILQCLDVVLGAMQFRLNDLHKRITPGKRRRGKRTIAKENLYKHILRRIRDIYPNFNIGITMGIQRRKQLYWEHPYRHWLFIPRDSIIDNTQTKGGN